MSNGYKKHYLKGSGRETVYDNGGSVIDVSMPLAELQKIPTWNTKSGDEWISFRITEKKEKGQYGDTHSISYSVKEGEEAKSSGSSEDDFFGDDD